MVGRSQLNENQFYQALEQQPICDILNTGDIRKKLCTFQIVNKYKNIKIGFIDFDDDAFFYPNLTIE